MPAASAPLTVCILGHEYTLDAPADAHPHLHEAARQLDKGMRRRKAREPAAEREHLAILAALDLLCTTPRERDLARGLTALQCKLDRLEAVLSADGETSPGDTHTEF